MEQVKTESLPWPKVLKVHQSTVCSILFFFLFLILITEWHTTKIVLLYLGICVKFRLTASHFFPPTSPEYFCYCHSWHSFLYFPSFSEGNVLRYRTELGDSGNRQEGITGTKQQRRATQNTRSDTAALKAPRWNLVKTLCVSLVTPFPRLFLS